MLTKNLLTKLPSCLSSSYLSPLKFSAFSSPSLLTRLSAFTTVQKWNHSGLPKQGIDEQVPPTLRNDITNRDETLLKIRQFVISATEEKKKSLKKYGFGPWMTIGGSITSMVFFTPGFIPIVITCGGVATITNYLIWKDDVTTLNLQLLNFTNKSFDTKTVNELLKIGIDTLNPDVASNVLKCAFTNKDVGHDINNDVTDSSKTSPRVWCQSPVVKPL